MGPFQWRLAMSIASSVTLGETVHPATGRLEAFFRSMIDLGQQHGSIDKAIKACATEKSLLTLMAGIRVLARGALDAPGLLAIRNSALILIGH